MATYTVTIDERTKAGNSLVSYLRNLEVIDDPNEATLSAISEIRNGGGTRCDSIEDYLKAVSVL